MSSNTLTTPARQTRGASASSIQGPSPHYVAGKRYALYGNEDRVVLDVGCKFIKYGFSGEATPRGLLDMVSFGAPYEGLWSLNTKWDRHNCYQVKVVLQKALRRIIQLELLLDARSRKVVLVEHPLWPRQVKAILAEILFDNLQSPSISTVPTHLSSLLASGTTTGMVIDVGHLETTLLPVFAARPLYVNLQATPCAGRRVLARLRALLLNFGRYSPPPPLSISSSNPSPPLQDVPSQILSDKVLLDLLHRACYVSPTPLSVFSVPTPSSDTPAPPSITTDHPSVDAYDESQDERYMRYLQAGYQANSSATNITVRVPPATPPVAGQPLVQGSLLIPGWIREHAADVLFEPGDEDEPSIVQCTLMALVKLPIDLRKTMISQMVVTGGLSMLPGFFSRFRTELVHSLSKARSVADAQVSQKQQRSRVSPQIPRRTESTRFHSISAMYAHVAILNDPCLPASEGDDTIHENAGTAPGFAPSVLAWIGASLSVALKTGGTEMSREQWSEVRMASVKVKSEDYLDVAVEYGLQDWTMPSLAVRA